MIRQRLIRIRTFSGNDLFFKNTIRQEIYIGPIKE